MAKGIIYLMSTVVNGLVKIGKTTDFEKRMQLLENNDYRNITGLKRVFAIEVNDYDEKEKLLDEIFAKSRVGDTELFSLDVNFAKQLLSALEGKIIYPATSKEEIFEEATEAVETTLVPSGTYYLNGISHKGNIKYNATIKYDEGKIILLKGSTFAPVSMKGNHGWLKERLTLDLEGNKLNEDHVCKSFSTASSIVLGYNSNGWVCWKNDQGEFIDIYRPKEINETE